MCTFIREAVKVVIHKVMFCFTFFVVNITVGSLSLFSVNLTLDPYIHCHITD